MRGLIGLFVVMVIGIGVFIWMQAKMAREPGPTILVAFGEPSEGEMEVNVCIPIAMRRMEVVSGGGMPRVLDPTDWIRRHWELRSGSGDTREMYSIGSSLLVSDTKAGGAPDFWIKSSAKVGESYKLIYMPDLTKDKKFEFEFDAKPGIRPRQRVEFEAMK